MFWLLSLALAADADVCNITRPVSMEELREIFDHCIVPEGTRITIHIEEVDSQPPKPGIGFKPNDIGLNQNGKTTLDRVVAVLSARKKLTVKIVGYADTVEQGDLVGLSYRRAEAAASYIIAAGIDSSRVMIEAGGADNRVDYSDTQEGHARNRRVEFVISATEPAK
jgi:outer membrane protein OmpA-like peptidoglycan-associated protein